MAAIPCQQPRKSASNLKAFIHDSLPPTCNKPPKSPKVATDHPQMANDHPKMMKKPPSGQKAEEGASTPLTKMNITVHDKIWSDLKDSMFRKEGQMQGRIDQDLSPPCKNLGKWINGKPKINNNKPGRMDHWPYIYMDILPP